MAMNRTLILSALLAPLLVATVLADVTLPAIISDHMVLMRSERVPIWGKAAPGEPVTVSLNGQVVKAKASADGKWSVVLDLKQSAPGPFAMTVEGKNNLVVSDVVVGEVWVASGQSNMEFGMKSAIDGEKEVAAPANPLIRQFLVKKTIASRPAGEANGRWVCASPETIPEFSAVGYYFAKRIHAELKVPVGLINASWGATSVEAWTSGEAIAGNPDLKEANERLWSAANEYPERKKTFVDTLTAWIKRNARDDKPLSDVSAYAGLDSPKDGWVPLKVPCVVKAPGLPDAGAVWLRKDVMLSRNGATVPLILPMDGFDSVYWNGKLLKQNVLQDYFGIGGVRHYGPYDIPGAQVLEGRNVLAIRFYEPLTPAKLSGGMKAGTTSIDGEWLAKAEYDFPALDAKALASVPQPPAPALGVLSCPSSIFNGMISPILPYAIRGVIWYQGENNCGRAYQYRTSFALLIVDWRKQWNQGDFPFYFCQLANHLGKNPAPGESSWAELREAQSMALKLPNTGQAVLIDVGEAGDIHPRNKKAVGERLALHALAKDYGKSLSYSGPVYDSLKIAGNKAILTFKHTDGGLVAKPLAAVFDVSTKSNMTAPLVRHSPNSQIEGFAICGEDEKWVWADARIDGSSVVVTSDRVAGPVAVRYAWADNPTCNLYNGVGLPASPFRTDDFPLTTLKAKY